MISNNSPEALGPPLHPFADKQGQLNMSKCCCCFGLINFIIFLVLLPMGLADSSSLEGLEPEKDFENWEGGCKILGVKKSAHAHTGKHGRVERCSDYMTWEFEFNEKDGFEMEEKMGGKHWSREYNFDREGWENGDTCEDNDTGDWEYDTTDQVWFEVGETVECWFPAREMDESTFDRYECENEVCAILFDPVEHVMSEKALAAALIIISIIIFSGALVMCFCWCALGQNICCAGSKMRQYKKEKAAWDNGGRQKWINSLGKQGPGFSQDLHNQAAVQPLQPKLEPVGLQMAQFHQQEQQPLMLGGAGLMQVQQQQLRTTTVPIPLGSIPGSTFHGTMPDGRQMMLTVPMEYIDTGIQQGVPVQY